MSVLCYHSVSPPSPEWNAPIVVAPTAFEQHCAWMHRHRRVLPLQDILGRIASGRRMPARSTSLTFDDGFADFYEHAAAVLTRYRLPSSMFLVARTLEPGGPAGADWLRPQPDEAPATLSRDQVLDLQSQGVEFGSHSWAHHDLRTLTEAECVRDLRDSRELLEDLLHRPVTTLAYPYGFHDPHVRRAARTAGYAYALALPDRPESAGRFAVPRAGVYRGNTRMTLRLKTSRFYLPVRTSSGYGALLRARRLLASRASA